MVADLNPEGDAFRSSYYLQPMLADVGGVLLFAADDGTHGQELWRSDGTAAGTTPVKDINPGLGDGIKFTYPLDFAVADGKLFFAANDGTHGSRLWMSDGTKNGTTQVSNLSFPYLNPTQAIANVNGSLFFQADDGIHGVELWMIPAKQLVRCGRHDYGENPHEDGDRGKRDGVPAAGFSAIRRTDATQSALTPNALTVAIAPVPTAPTVAVARRLHRPPCRGVPSILSASTTRKSFSLTAKTIAVGPSHDEDEVVAMDDLIVQG